MSALDRGNPVDEIQERNGQKHQRVFDPLAYRLLGQILTELQKMNAHLAIITDEEDINDEN